MAKEHCIHARDVQVDDDRVVFPADVKRVGSYNWSTTSTSGQPRIIVPGSPLNYVHPTRRVFELSRDGGESWFEDENAIKMRPFSAMEPVFHSLSICAPDIDLGAFDVIADKFVFMKLLKFCRSPGDKELEHHCGVTVQPFKFFIHAKGQDRDGKPPTVVFSSARAEQEGEKYTAGFGGRFHDTVTEKDPSTPSDAARFHLIRTMDLDGIALLVRSGVGARDTGETRAPSPSRRRANNMAALNERLRDLLCEAAGQAEPQEKASPSSPAKKAPLSPTPSGPRICVDAAGQNETQQEVPPATSPAKTALLPSTTTEHRTTADEEVPLASSDGNKGPSGGSPTGSGLESRKSGELLSEDAKLVELKVANGRYRRIHNWKNFLWNLLLGGAQTLMVGVYEIKCNNRDVATFRRPEHLGIDEVKARADETGSSSMVYLANTLREVVKAAHHLIVNSPRTDGATGDHPGVVVECAPEVEKVLRVRLAVPEDDAIAP